MNVTRVQQALFGLAFLFCATPAFAQEPNWAEKMFEKRSHDFGVVARGADIKHRLYFTNKYVENVRISSVTTSCGCASAEAGSQEPILSRQTGYVDISMDTRKFTHEKNSTVIITFDQPLHEVVRIPVKTYIRTDVVLTPGSVEFGSVSVGSPSERRVSVTYAGRDNWQVHEVVNRNPNLEARIQETGRGAGRVTYELFVTIKGSAAPGPFRDQITLLTDDAGSPQIPVLVEGRVEAAFTVTPEVVAFGAVNVGDRATRQLVVRGKKPFAIEKIESERTSGVFEVRLPNDRKLIHLLPLTATGTTDGESLDEEFTITIAETGETVQFKSNGKVVPSTTAANSPPAN